MWPMEFAVFDDTVFIRIEVSEGQVAYMLPIGGELEKSLDTLDSFQPGKKLFYNIPGNEAEILKQRYNNVSISPIASGGDYLYCAESMATLSGRKLHGQRNHCNYFERTWAHHFEEITNTNVRDVIDFIERKEVSNSSELLEEGNRKTLEVFDNLDIYGFSSLALYAESKVVGFTFGTLLGDTLYVTIEQADRDYRGVYPKLSSTFVSKHLEAGAVYVNREDDLGDEGLRKAKLAWNPLEIIDKLAVVVEG